MNKQLNNWLPVVVWMGCIYYLSSRSSVTVSTDSLFNFLFFKTLHLIEYAVLYMLVFRASSQRRTSVRFATAFGITVCYAITDELHQTFVPTREGKVRDVIIDAAGASLAWICIATIVPKLPKKLSGLVKNWLCIY